MEQSEKWLSSDWNSEMQISLDEPECGSTLTNLDVMEMSLC